MHSDKAVGWVNHLVAAAAKNGRAAVEEMFRELEDRLQRGQFPGAMR